MDRDGKEFKSWKVRRPAIVKLLREKSEIAMCELLEIYSKLVSGFLKTIVLALALMNYSCQSQTTDHEHQSNPKHGEFDGKSNVKHALGFDLIEYQNYKVLHLFRHFNESIDTLSYILKNHDVAIDNIPNALTTIDIPVKRIALLHSSYLSFFKCCEAVGSIAAISESKHIYDDEIYKSVTNGTIAEIGYGESFDKEKLLELGISIVITVGWPNTPNKEKQILDELGIPMIVFSEWHESTLLGRAEWVKVVAALTGTGAIANSKFEKVESEYEKLKLLAANTAESPKVICNLPYKGSWYVPGGKSYMGNALLDAGGNYLWSDDAGTGGLQMDFEAVFAKGLSADIWMNPGAAISLNEIALKDERLKDFLPLKNERVFNYTKRIARETANDYWESAIINPHLVLSDYIKILHPEVIPDYQLYYYNQLR